MEKAAAIAPRPVAGLLRPVVHCQTIRYNARVRAGRGFTLDELKVSTEHVTQHKYRQVKVFQVKYINNLCTYLLLIIN